MATVKLAAGVPPKTFGAGSLQFVPLQRISDNEKITPIRQVSKSFVTELKDDIRKNGLIAPLLVWNGGPEEGKLAKNGAGATFAASFLVAGFHRRAALKAFAKEFPDEFNSRFPKGVPVYVMDGELSDVVAAQLRENIGRRSMRADEVLPAVVRLKKEFGLKMKDIGARIGKSESWVSQILDAEETLGEDGMRAVIDGDLTVGDAMEAKEQIKKAKKAGAVVDTKEVIEKAKSKRAKTKAKGKQRADRRLSAKALYKRVSALPNMKMGQKLDIVLNALAYLAQANDDEGNPVELPEELAAEVEEDEADGEGEE